MEIRNKLKSLLPEAQFNETTSFDSVRVSCIVGGVPYQEWQKCPPGSNQTKALEECYFRLYRSLTRTAEQAMIDHAFVNRWMKNVIDNIGDANGETIPSISQVREELNNSKP